MAINPNRPVISYENIALFHSSTPAHNVDSNSGQNISFLPLVQGINFSIDVGRTNAGALGTKDFIDQSNRSAPDVNLTINTIENFGHLFSDLISGLSVEGGLNTDKNFYAVLAPKRAFDISKDSVMGKETLGFGNCFINNISISQSAKGLLSSEYTYVGSNVQAETLTNSLAATNQFITKDDTRVIFVYDGNTFAESRTNDGVIELVNGRTKYQKVGVFLQTPFIFWDSNNNYWVKQINQFGTDPLIEILNNGEDTPYPYLALDNTIRSEYTVTPAIGSAPSLNLNGDQSQSVASSFDPMHLYYTNDADGVIPSYDTNVSISGSSSFGNFLIRSDSIQSFDLDLPINRKSIYSLGKKYPVKRKALFPSAGSFSFSNLVSSFELNGHMANLKDFLSSDEDYTIDVAGENTKGEDFHVRIEEAKLVSQSQTSSIEENISANLGFSFELNNLKKFNLLERFPDASLAYSLRDLHGTMGNNPVVDVRRANNGDIRAFSAKEITDGTLTSWAKLNPPNEAGIMILTPSNNAFVTKWYDQSLSVTSVYEAYPTIFANSSVADNVGFSKTDEETFTIEASNSTSARFITLVNASNGLELGKHRITCDVTENVGLALNVIGVYADNDAEILNGNSFNTFGFSAGSNVIDFEIFDDGEATSPPIIQLVVFAGTTCNISFSNFKITRVVDESFTQNNNHATQTDPTKQPKIVEGGKLVTRTINGKHTPSIKFSADTHMNHGLTSLSSDGQQSLFIVMDNQVTSSTLSTQTYSRPLEIESTTASEVGNGRNRRPLIFLDDLNQRIFFSMDSFGGLIRLKSESNFLSVYSSITNDTPNPSDATENGTHVARQDGTQFGLEFVTLDANSTVRSDKKLGRLGSNIVGDFFISEIIYYPSDQSANRISIEKDIKNYYKTNTIVTEDTTRPVITLNGADIINLAENDTYSEQGATTDDGTEVTITSNNIDTSTAAFTSRNNPATITYLVTYDATDGAGNDAERVTRTIRVTADPARNTTAPVITRIGSATIYLTQGDTFEDPGATATDDIDGDISNQITTTSNVDTSTPGSYSVTYNVSDSAGNAANTVTRVIIVSAIADTTAPVITLIGNSTVNLTEGDTFEDPGATASDNVDGNLTSSISTNSNVDTSSAGTYTVTYNVSDAAGNAATTVTRTVIVSAPVGDTTAPVITLLGNSPLNLTEGDTFEDPGASASDDVDGNLTANITSTNNVDTSAAGSYTVTYSVTDNAGNTATETRTVLVSADASANEFRYYRFSGANSDGSVVDAGKKMSLSEIKLFENGGTEYPTEALTSNTSETNITVSAGQQYSNSWAPWKAFDDTANGIWYTHVSAPNAGLHWAQIDLGEAKNITGIDVQSNFKGSLNNVDKLIIYGSNNGSTFSEWGSTSYSNIPGNGTSFFTVEPD